MDLLLSQLPLLMPYFVVYGALATTAAAIYILAFFVIVGSVRRSCNRLNAPSRALGASLTLLTPVAGLLSALAVAAQRNDMGDFSIGEVLLLNKDIRAWGHAA